MTSDPDFCTLVLRAGTDFDMPSPGSTTLELQPDSDFVVTSLFQLNYEIEFAGCPSSPLEGLSGTDTGSVQMAQGFGPSVPATRTATVFATAAGLLVAGAVVFNRRAKAQGVPR